MIKRFFIGLAIGAGAILPGISSGVLCVIFGIYEKLIDSVLNFFKNIKKNFYFLFPIILGGIVGIILLGNALNYLFFKFPVQTKSIFIGLILGTIPSLIKQLKINCKEKKYNKKLNIAFFIISLIIGIFMVFLENSLNINTSHYDFSYTYLFFSGLLMSIGIVVPGVSSTIILMLLGTYYTYISAVACISINILIPIAIGVFIGSLIFMKIIQYLLNNYYTQTFSCIIGFSIGSILVLFPTINNFIDIIICILGISLGLLIGIKGRS